MQKNLIEEEIARLVKDSIKELFQITQDSFQVQLDIPKAEEHGDLSTNTAMRLAKVARQRPLDIAQKISEYLQDKIKDHPKLKRAIDKIEVKAPGFINFWLANTIFHNTLESISKEKNRFGRNELGKGKKVLCEYVSANPTGPLTIAHARQAAFGDSLGNLLDFCSYKVKKEYYINDEGVQISLLGDSVLARYIELLKRDSQFPENGYKGAYIYDIAKEIIAKHGEKYAQGGKADREYFGNFACGRILEWIRKDLEDFSVDFDIWFSQAKLSKTGNIEKAVSTLRKKEFIYDAGGASWFKSTAFGDDKDRVVIKSDGAYTYLAPDIAYHQNKFKRGFDKLIDIWGPDHHGYVPRINAAVEALGHNKDEISVIIIQLVTLFREGKPVSMSTRQGEFVTLRELIDEVGRDAARFFFLMRKAESHLDFDLELAKKHSLQNPVYYVQYAHARICSIVEKGSTTKVKKVNLDLLKEEEEMRLIKFLWRFPHIVQACGTNLEPHGLVVYLQDLAKTFHLFYDKHRVIGDDADLSAARLTLVQCAKTILATGLSLLGVSAPEKM